LDVGSLGRYQLLDLLGAGGMGQVYRAHDTVTNRTVALKVLPPHLADDSDFQRRFVREANTIAALTEPHIVPIHGFGDIDGHLYVDMRLIEGRDLASILADGPLTTARAVGIIEQIAAALDAAHRAGLVHRDVKPSNILVTDSDFAYLIDFGIAWTAEGTSMTGTGNMIGTFQYMAPERFRVGPIDGRSDTYSLACVLYECLTGDLPFPGTAVEQQVAGHVATPPPRPSAFSGVPTDFDDVITKGMAKNPDDRYPRVLDFARAARAASEGRPAAPPTSPAAFAYPPTPPPPPPRAPVPAAATPTSWQQYAPLPSPTRSGRRPLMIAAAVVAVALTAVVSIILSTKDSGHPSSAKPSDTTAVAAPADLLAKASKLAAAATSGHYDLTVVGDFENFPIVDANADATNVPVGSAKGKTTTVVVGQKISDIDFVDVANDLYLALTPNNWTSMGPSSDIFAFANVLNPSTGVANLLSTATSATGGSTTDLNGQRVVEVDATIPAEAVNNILRGVATQPVPATTWIAADTGALAKITLHVDTQRSITLAFSNWNEPVTVSKPVA